MTKIFSTLADQHLRFEFRVLAQSNDDSMKVACRAVSGSLCDIGGNRHGSFSGLERQPELFVRREVLRDLINEIGEIHRLLPDDEITVAPDLSAHASPLCSMRALLPASPSSLFPNPYSPIPNPESPIPTP